MWGEYDTRHKGLGWLRRERGSKKMGKYDTNIQKIAEGMQGTETALLATGFSSVQWNLIRTYILAALELNDYAAINKKED